MGKATGARGALHELARFAQATLIAMAVEMLSFVLLNRFLPAQGPGLGEVERRTGAAFLLSAVAANALSFVLNRRRTFNSHNSLRYAVPVYGLYSLLMIAMQTVLGPLLEGALAGAMGGRAAVVSKAIWMAVNFGISFPVNKWVIMRPFPAPRARESGATGLHHSGGRRP